MASRCTPAPPEANPDQQTLRLEGSGGGRVGRFVERFSDGPAHVQSRAVTVESVGVRRSRASAPPMTATRAASCRATALRSINGVRVMSWVRVGGCSDRHGAERVGRVTSPHGGLGQRLDVSPTASAGPDGLNSKQPATRRVYGARSGADRVQLRGVSTRSSPPGPAARPRGPTKVPIEVARPDVGQKVGSTPTKAPGSDSGTGAGTFVGGTARAVRLETAAGLGERSRRAGRPAFRLGAPRRWVRCVCPAVLRGV